MLKDFKDEEKKEEKKNYNVPSKKTKQLYTIALVADGYIIVNDGGNGRKIEGTFKDKKIGDSIELE